MRNPCLWAESLEGWEQGVDLFVPSGETLFVIRRDGHGGGASQVFDRRGAVAVRSVSRGALSCKKKKLRKESGESHSR